MPWIIPPPRPLPGRGVDNGGMHSPVFLGLGSNLGDRSAALEEAVVRRVAGLVIGNEYKRRQGASGVRITSRAFGRDRRYPITSGWRERP